MKKRSIIFSVIRDAELVKGQGTTNSVVFDTKATYDTASYGWTLTGWTLTDPEQKTQYVEKVGGDGSWDLSTSTTDGIPRYKDRTLTATLECSEGTREDRTRLISNMVNLLDGFRWEIVLPDHPDHFLVGRVRVQVNQNSLAYAAVTLTATCEPWLYYEHEVRGTPAIKSATEWSFVRVYNNGRRVLAPTLIVEGTIRAAYYTNPTTGQAFAYTLTTGTHKPLGILLHPGLNFMAFQGTGSVTVVYREAVLR